MKKVKYAVWLIILASLGVLIYQNQAYFLAEESLKVDMIKWKYTLPAIPNVAYWGICLLVGLLLAGFKGLLVSFRLKREIKEKTAFISKLEKENDELSKELAPFQGDPYIRKGLEEIIKSAKAAEAEKPAEAAGTAAEPSTPSKDA
jgi:hypothetical protein